MEKLKVKHDHKLTDILKVAIFGLMLILPGLILLPSMLYYGVNEHATAPTEQVEKIEYERVDFNQLMPNNKIHFSYSGVNPAFEDYATLNLKGGHKYAFKFTPNTYPAIPSGAYTFYLYNFSSGQSTIYQLQNNIYTINLDTTATLGYATYNIDNNYYQYEGTINYFDLTQMFGSGNEPTYQEFSTWYAEDYYDYTTSRYEILEIPTGTYETYTDITSQIQYNWNSLWQQPLFSWTNYTIIKQGIDNFTGVFGITNTSNISNLIAYELIIVAIYIVIDIVLTLFKWLTHLIGEK